MSVVGSESVNNSETSKKLFLVSNSRRPYVDLSFLGVRVVKIFRKMNFKLVTCYRRQKYPKVNVASKKSVKKKSSGKKKRKSSSSHRSRRVKNSYVSSNLYTRNFYPANYFFQDEPKIRYSNTRVGVNDQTGYLITRNTPRSTLTRRLPPSTRTPSHHFGKVG